MYMYVKLAHNSWGVIHEKVGVRAPGPRSSLRQDEEQHNISVRQFALCVSPSL